MQYAVSSGTLHYTDESDIRRACEQIVYRVVGDFYTRNKDFKERLEHHVHMKIIDTKNLTRSPSEYTDAIQKAKAHDYSIKDARKLTVFFSERMKSGACER
jgi:hypothetical protein